MASHASDLPPDPLLVEIEPDQDYSPEAFRASIERLLARPEPTLESVGAAEVLREIRADVDPKE